MNTSKEIDNSEPIPTNFLFISIFVFFVASVLPAINPLTPRLNSDFFAFIGLGLLAWRLIFTYPGKLPTLA